MRNFLSIQVIVLLAGLALCMANASLFAAEEKGYLRLRIEPPVAGVFVDGKYRGSAALFLGHRKALPLSPGTHEVRIVDPRYEELVETVEIEPGRSVTLRKTLKKIELAEGPFGTLKVKSRGLAAVYVDGKYYGHSDEFDGPEQGILLKPGTYVIRVEPLSGGGVFVRDNVKIEADKTTLIRMPQDLRTDKTVTSPAPEISP